MRKRILALPIILIMFIITTGMNFKADSTNKILRIGLRNMVANSIKIVLNGNYTVDGISFDTGTESTLTISKGQVIFEGEVFDSISFVPSKPENTIKLEVGAKKYSYRGTMTFNPTVGGILPINVVDIETYLKGVVAFEMSNSYPLEALKAQAVAARSYALSSIGKHKTLGYDLCDTTDCQVYRGYNTAFGNVIKAVDQTSNKVLVYGNDLVCAFFTASSGGFTEASGNIWKKQLPYLIAKKDDMENENWPYGNQIFTKAQIETKLKSKNYLKSSDNFINLDLDSIVRNESGRVASIDIVYSNSLGVLNRKSIIKEGTRTFLSLPSALYYISYDAGSDVYTFSGKGYGHGVGLSQIGAKNRAIAGQTYDRILQFYYDGTQLANMNSNIINDSTDITNTTDTAISKDSSSGGGIDITTGSSIDEIPTTSTGGASLPTTTGASINLIPTPNENPVKVTKPDSNSKPGTTAVAAIRDLKKGMSGNDVKQLQDSLKKLKLLNIKNTTTYFGDSTEKAVKAFQKNNGLKVNGIADKLTQDIIKNLLMIESVRNQKKM